MRTTEGTHAGSWWCMGSRDVSYFDEEPTFAEGEEEDLIDEVGLDEEHQGVDGANIVHSSAGNGPIPDGAGEGVPNTERMTTPYMTKYEKARILGTRALQIRCVLRPCYWNRG